MSRIVFYRASFFIPLIGLFLAAISAQAYTPSRTQTGAGVKWEGPSVRLKMVGNPTNRAGFSEQQFKDSVVRSLQRWKSVSLGGVDFDYWQGTDTGVYVPNSEYNQRSSIYFASNARGTSGSNPAVLGLTQIWYDTNTGRILEGDVVINDVDHRFSLNARDSYSGANPQGATGIAYLDSVITHELGHVLGLSHSQVMQSTMFFTEAPEQSHLGCDDQIGIQTLYGNRGTNRSTLMGTVKSEGGNPLFGAHVVAISARRGTALASALTEPNGSFLISGLEKGTYFLMVEPFYAGGSALPYYYAGIGASVCPGGNFARSFKMSGTNRLETIELNVDQDIGTITARCSNGAAVTQSSAASGFANAPVIHQGTGGYTNFGFADRMSSSSLQYYRVQNVTGRLEVRILAYGLYSSLDTDVRILDVAGNPISAQAVGDVYSGESGFANRDSVVTVSGLPLGEYVIEVSAKKLSSSSLPGGGLTADAASFMVVSGLINPPGLPAGDELAFNARCRSTENFENYSDPTDAPPGSDGSRELSSEDDSGGFLGFCGTISGGPRSGGFPGAGPLFSWFAPWIFMLAVLGLRIRGLPINFRL